MAKVEIGGLQIDVPELDLRVRKETMRKLDDPVAHAHIHNLSYMLDTLSRLVYEKMEELQSADNAKLQDYLKRFSSTLGLKIALSVTTYSPRRVSNCPMV